MGAPSRGGVHHHVHKLHYNNYGSTRSLLICCLLQTKLPSRRASERNSCYLAHISPALPACFRYPICRNYSIPVTIKWPSFGKKSVHPSIIVRTLFIVVEGDGSKTSSPTIWSSKIIGFLSAATNKVGSPPFIQWIYSFFNCDWFLLPFLTTYKGVSCSTVGPLCFKFSDIHGQRAQPIRPSDHAAIQPFSVIDLMTGHVTGSCPVRFQTSQAIPQRNVNKD